MRRLALITMAALALVASSALAESNVDPGHKFAWGENIGWTNWRDANNGADGVRIFGTYLAGWIWCENVGWLSVGDGTPGGGSFYTNADGSDFGVNIVDAAGNLEGFGWGENFGWVTFNTSSLGPLRARFDRAGGRFRGYAWAENVGWLNLNDDQRFVGVSRAALDIKPGSCPNPFNRNSRGVLPVGLLGTADFDLTHVDVSSVVLSRVDGVGGQVAPLHGPPGPHPEIADVGTPFAGEPCDCHAAAGDGTPDLSLKFKTQDVVAELELNSVAPGTTVELAVSGSLLDGTTFSARDCIRIVPAPGPDAVSLSVGANQPDTYVEVSPPDPATDGSGFTPFDRCYNNGTAVTLTAPASSNGRVFAGWTVNGVSQPSSQRTIQVIVEGIINLEAAYRTRSGQSVPIMQADN